MKATLHAVEPGSAVQSYLVLDGNELQVDGFPYDLTKYRKINLLAFGKAAYPMAATAAAILHDRLDKTIIITPYRKLSSSIIPPEIFPERLELLESSHPIPSEKSTIAGKAIIDLLSNLTPADLLICLISGGGSALVAAPVPGINLEDLASLTHQLLVCGAPIGEVNTLRKHLDLLKGGNLTRLAGGAQIITLVLSDVIGDPLDVIASGPTVPDPSTFSDAWEILEQYAIINSVSPNIRAVLQAGLHKEMKETPKPGDPIFQLVHNVIVGSNTLASQAGLAQARVEGFNVNLLTTYLQGEARQVGAFLSLIARQMNDSGQPLPRPACLISGGETTVTVEGDGLGGRNQELALAAVPGLAGLPGTILVSLATDGIDGPTDAAGAVVDGDTITRAKAHNLDVHDYLARNDAYHFFEALDDLLKPGFTYTNVNDLVFIFTV